MHSPSRSFRRHALWAIVAASLLLVTSMFVAPTPPASAAPTIVPAVSAAGFDPGFIISDEKFYDSSTMTEAQIQSFLNSQVPSCRAGYVCLKDYRITTYNKTADAMCKGYTGARNESAARIIAKVSQSCGINPQVILVMLQKEQGLVTHTWPSDYRFDEAMGQACPDTPAGCDPAYKGLFSQVYGGAWQMKRYSNPPGTSQTFTWYAPGKTWNIRWTVDAACGSAPVYVRNQATSNLYYYTPYQPNKAALDNLYGTGDACSAYGNRNFWRYFSDWFGDPTGGVNPMEKTARDWAASLGTKQSDPVPVTGNGKGLGQMFSNGSIYYIERAGSHAVVEPIRAQYWAWGAVTGKLGWPTSDPISIAVPGGMAQAFEGGSVYSSWATGTAAVYGAILNTYFSRGGSDSDLGLPNTQESSITGGRTQGFQNGQIVTSSRGTFAVLNPIRGYLAGRGGIGSTKVGLPTSDPVSYDGAVGQTFTTGSVYSSKAGVFSVTGAVRTEYWRTGADTLGWPTSEASCSGKNCLQTFDRGVIVTGTQGAATVLGAIGSYYASKKGSAGTLGWPASAQLSYSENGGATAQIFSGGSVYSTGAGTFTVTGAMRDGYFSAGTTTMGWPTAEQRCSGSTCTQRFQNGTVMVDTKTGAVTPMMGTIGDYYRSKSAATGVPLSPSYRYSENGGAWGQVFQNGSVYASAAGTFLVGGDMRTAYFDAGVDSLGWPTGEAACGSGVCTQAFQKGIIRISNGTPTVVSGAIGTYYLKNGGLTGRLGLPTSARGDYSEAGGASGQMFVGGSVYTSSAGTFTVSGALRDAYWALGAGSLGWPAGEASCAGSICTQKFQRGVLSVDSKSGRTGTATGAIGTYWARTGGASGSLGWPASGVGSYPESGGATGQMFDGGSVYSSSAGTFTVSGAMRDAYWAAGASKMGWPAGEASCSSSGCTQKFQKGTLKSSR